MPPKPEEIQEKMEQWCRKTADLSSEKDPGITAGSEIKYRDLAQNIQKIAELQMQFEMIHPFQDGNGRTGRFVMDQMLLNAGLLPTIILNQSKYRQVFRIYERNRDTNLMEHCIVQGVAKAYEILKDICKKMGEELRM